MFNQKDTIFALATGINSSINIIRISGDKAIETIQEIFVSAQHKKLKTVSSHKIYYGWVIGENKIIDEVILMVMKKPNSYTKQDVVEIHFHGNLLIADKIAELLLSKKLRIAEAGEFSKRAFLNGRIDLTKAEATAQIITAQNEIVLESSINQLQGSLYQKIEYFREKIIWVLSLLNAQVDFIDENIFFTNIKKVTNQLQQIDLELKHLIQNFNQGRLINEGIKVVLVGVTNAGKSSIMNGLLKEERVIVTPTAGTTRDTIEETISIEGVKFSFVDTAGIRKTSSKIEQTSIKKTKQVAQQADLILWVIDSHKPNFSFEIEIKSQIPIVLVLNKNDLNNLTKNKIPAKYQNLSKISISSFSKKDLKRLETVIYSKFFKNQIVKEQLLIINKRQQQAILNIKKQLKSSINFIKQGYGEEIIANELNNALSELNNIVGITTTEDLLEKIFANFCIGK